MNSEHLHACTKPEKQLPGSLSVIHQTFGKQTSLSIPQKNYTALIKNSVIYVHDKNILTNILALSVNILIIRSKLVTEFEHMTPG